MSRAAIQLALDALECGAIQAAIVALRAALAATPAQPLSDDQIDDLMPTNTSMPRSDALRWMARAVERAHDCAAAIRSGK